MGGKQALRPFLSACRAAGSEMHKRHSKANLCFQLMRVVYDCLIKVDNRRGSLKPSGRSVAFKIAALAVIIRATALKT